MRKTITTAALAGAGVALMAPAAEAASARATVIRVVDGDTVRVRRPRRRFGVSCRAAVRLTTDGRRRGVYVGSGEDRNRVWR